MTDNMIGRYFLYVCLLMSRLDSILMVHGASLPSIPDEWTATIEANIVNKNYSIHMDEWHDQINDRGRVDIFSYREHGMTSSIYDFANQVYYHTNTSGCFWGSTDRISGFNFLTTHTGGSTHLTTTQRLMALASNATHAYVGTGSVRGILCDMWETNVTCAYSNSSYTDPCDMNYTLRWFFSEAHWTIPENSEAVRVPVRIDLSGQKMLRYDWSTRTVRDPPILTEIYHVYDYVKFQPGTPDPADFERPCGQTCASDDAEWSTESLSATSCPEICETFSSSDGDWSSSSVGGLAFGMVLVGALIGAGGLFVFSRLNMKNAFGDMDADASLGGHQGGSTASVVGL